MWKLWSISATPSRQARCSSRQLENSGGMGKAYGPVREVRIICRGPPAWSIFCCSEAGVIDGMRLPLQCQLLRLGPDQVKERPYPQWQMAAFQENGRHIQRRN